MIAKKKIGELLLALAYVFINFIDDDMLMLLLFILYCCYFTTTYYIDYYGDDGRYTL